MRKKARPGGAASCDADGEKRRDSGQRGPCQVLSGTQVLKAEGKIVRNRGKARYELENAEFNGVWVPAWLASAVVSFVGKNQPPHIDITEDFDLPYGITGLVFYSDRVEITR